MRGLRFGCHISIKEGYFGAAKTAHELGAKSFQYFPKNPRSLSIKDFDQVDAERAKEFIKNHDMVSISHTPYPTDLTPPKDKEEMVIQSLINDLEITNACGSVGVVVHFGKHRSDDKPLEGYQKMIEVLNQVLIGWKGPCKILLENNAGTPGTMGTTLEEMVQIRSLCEYPEKIGFCLDTCHAFASGIWTGENWKELEKNGKKLGYFEHLVAIHLNNSKYPVESGKDRHAPIFQGGYIEESHFEKLLTSSLLSEIPFILETPDIKGTTKKEELEQLEKKWGT